MRADDGANENEGVNDNDSHSDRFFVENENYSHPWIEGPRGKIERSHHKI